MCCVLRVLADAEKASVKLGHRALELPSPKRDGSVPRTRPAMGTRLYWVDIKTGQRRATGSAQHSPTSLPVEHIPRSYTRTALKLNLPHYTYRHVLLRRVAGDLHHRYVPLIHLCVLSVADRGAQRSSRRTTASSVARTSSRTRRPRRSTTTPTSRRTATCTTRRSSSRSTP